jgi:hypothetical protein
MTSGLLFFNHSQKIETIPENGPYSNVKFMAMVESYCKVLQN